MDDASYREYIEESSDWLKQARSRLLAHLIEQSTPPPSHSCELLEVGAGAGQNLQTLSGFGAVDAVEIHPLGRANIQKLGIARAVYECPVPFELDRRYDVICALDVIEHVKPTLAVMRWMAEHLKPGGVLILTVPAYQWLFSAHDQSLGHYRRYTKSQLLAELPPGFEVLRAAYFTHLLFPFAVLSRFAWSLQRRLLGSSTATQPSPQDGPLAALLGAVMSSELKMIRHGFAPPFGLSIFCVARKL